MSSSQKDAPQLALFGSTAASPLHHGAVKKLLWLGRRSGGIFECDKRVDHSGGHHLAVGGEVNQPHARAVHEVPWQLTLDAEHAADAEVLRQLSPRDVLVHQPVSAPDSDCGARNGDAPVSGDADLGDGLGVLGDRLVHRGAGREAQPVDLQGDQVSVPEDAVAHESTSAGSRPRRERLPRESGSAPTSLSSLLGEASLGGPISAVETHSRKTVVAARTPDLTTTTVCTMNQLNIPSGSWTILLL